MTAIMTSAIPGAPFGALVRLDAGDARAASGATIGQSLPNWGPVANEGRGRTVAMTDRKSVV